MTASSKRLFFVLVAASVLLVNVWVQNTWVSETYENDLLNLSTARVDSTTIASVDPWAYEEWTYRKRNHVEYTYDERAGTGYQIQIEVRFGFGTSIGRVYVEGNCQDDFDDIRFADDDGSELSYWMEPDYIPFDRAFFWVKLKDSVSSSDQDIYMYYGNPNVETTSNGDETFLFFDDFDDSSLDASKWYENHDSGTLEEELGRLEIHGSDSGWETVGAKTQFSDVVAFHYRAIFSEAHAHQLGVDERSADGTSSGSIDRALWRYYNGKEYYTQDDSGSDSDPRTTPLNVWTELELRLSAGTSVEFIENGILRKTMTSNVPDTDVGQRFEVLNDGFSFFVDWTFTRNWVPEEPFHDYWYDEEVSSDFVPPDDISEWNYCKPHIIKKSAGAGSNYQVKIRVYQNWPPFGAEDHGYIVYSCDRAQDDLDDVRFLDSNGRFLDYWCEKVDFELGSNYADFWVEIRDDLSTADSTLYVYYGNDNAESRSNGDATFLFFDDFDDSSIDTSKWYEQHDSGMLEEFNGLLAIRGGTSGWETVGAKTQFSDNIAFHYRAKFSEAHSIQLGVDERSSDGTCSGAIDRALWNYYNGKNYYTQDDSGSDSEARYTTLNEWANFELRLNGGTSVKFYNNGFLAKTMTSNVPNTDVGQRFEVLNSGRNIYVDWTFTRKCIQPEPVHDAWEESAGFRLPAVSGSYEFVEPIDDPSFEENNNDWDVVYGSTDWDGNDCDTDNDALLLYGSGICSVEQAIDETKAEPLRGSQVQFSFAFKGDVVDVDNYARAVIWYEIDGERYTDEGEWINNPNPQGREWRLAEVVSRVPLNLDIDSGGDSMNVRIEVWRTDGGQTSIVVDTSQLVVVGPGSRMHDSPDWWHPNTNGWLTLSVHVMEYVDEGQGNRRAKISAAMYAEPDEGYYISFLNMEFFRVAIDKDDFTLVGQGHSEFNSPEPTVTSDSLSPYTGSDLDEKASRERTAIVFIGALALGAFCIAFPPAAALVVAHPYAALLVLESIELGAGFAADALSGNSDVGYGVTADYRYSSLHRTGCGLTTTLSWLSPAGGHLDWGLGIRVSALWGPVGGPVVTSSLTTYLWTGATFTT